MLYLAQLKDKLLKKYHKEQGFYELALPSTYPYVISLNSPTSKELLNELPKVRAWQQEYENSKLAPFLIYQEHKARGALGSHRVLAQVCFPDCHTLENFIAPQKCPKVPLSQDKLLTNKPVVRGMANTNTLAPAKSQVLASMSPKTKSKEPHKSEPAFVPSLMEQLGLADCFAQYAKENELELNPAYELQQDHKDKQASQASKECFSSLSDQDFFKALDSKDNQEPAVNLALTSQQDASRSKSNHLSLKAKTPQEHELGEPRENIKPSCQEGGSAHSSREYVIAHEVLLGLDEVKEHYGPLKDQDRKIAAPVGSFKCFHLQMSRIQEPLYSDLALSSHEDKLKLRNQGLNEYIKTHSRTIADMGYEFWVVVQLIDYLAYLDNTPHIYARQISLPLMDTKFIERHYRIIDDLLMLCLPQERNSQSLMGVENEEQGIKKARSFTDFLKKWGFAYKKEMIRWRMLDPKMSTSLYEDDHNDKSIVPALDATAGSMLDSIVPLDVLAHLKLKFDHVIICENEVCYLTLPAITNSIAIFGSGYKVSSLSELHWLKDKDIIYWGDIDTHGFNILNSFRESLNSCFKDNNYDASSKVRTILMDIDTLKSNKHFIVKESEVVSTFLRTLKGDDYLCYEALVNNLLGTGVRLEQELIPFNQVLAALKKALPHEHIIFGAY